MGWHIFRMQRKGWEQYPLMTLWSSFQWIFSKKKMMNEVPVYQKKNGKNGQFSLVLPPPPKIFNPTFVSKSIKVPTLLVYDWRFSCKILQESSCNSLLRSPPSSKILQDSCKIAVGYAQVKKDRHRFVRFLQDERQNQDFYKICGEVWPEFCKTSIQFLQRSCTISVELLQEPCKIGVHKSTLSLIVVIFSFLDY